ncbi:MAG: universal stress protein [Phycisphaerae bacterium]|nr:universal stress protein [Phycisphaerae bacterium]
MAKISRILFPTDYSGLSEGAAPHAALEARAHGAGLIVLHLIEPVVANTPSAVGVMPVVDEITPDDRDRIRRFAERHFAGLECHTEVRHGFPARDISPYAAGVQADLIVIGTHADGILKRIIHGSVSKSVLESSPCAVLMVPLAAIKADAAR